MATERIADNSAFDEEVMRSKRPVLVSFRAAGCLPSQQMAPMIDALGDRFDARAKVVVVDVKEDDWRENEILREHGITRLPVVMLFEGGKVRDFIGGETTEEAVAEMLEARLKPVLDVDALTFDAEVLEEDRPVLVHFHAAWCRQSLQLVPEVEEVASSLDARAKVVRVERTGDNAALFARYGVSRVPTLAVLRRGEVVDQIFGAMTGGAKQGARRASCVNLTTFENISQLVEGSPA